MSQQFRILFASGGIRDDVVLATDDRFIDADLKEFDYEIGAVSEGDIGEEGPGFWLWTGYTVSKKGYDEEYTTYWYGSTREITDMAELVELLQMRPPEEPEEPMVPIAAIAPPAKHKPIPPDFAVQPLAVGAEAKDHMTCGHCGLSWDNAIPTSWTPTPSGRCPFEYYHLPE